MYLNVRFPFLITTLLAIMLLFLSSSSAAQEKIVDMTFPFSEESIYWPTDKGFTPKLVFKGISAGGWWYSSNEYGASEHGGTHVDAPIHFYENGRTIGQIP